MTFELNPMKAMRMFSALWVLLIPSLWLYWADWARQPIMLALVGGLPVWAAMAAYFIGRRWRLELTPDALIHHTLARREVFPWGRMGQLEIKRGPLVLLFTPFLWFPFPTDGATNVSEHASKLIGRRLLLVFGDHSAKEILKQIEDWRELYATKPLKTSSHD
jgi:hypothetical protein